jgi:hypothetical protein
MRSVSLGIVGCGNVTIGASTLLEPLVAEGVIGRLAVCDVDPDTTRRAVGDDGDVAATSCGRTASARGRSSTPDRRGRGPMGCATSTPAHRVHGRTSV